VITLNTKTGEFKFNLKTGYPREIELCQIITRLQSKNSTASINIVTSYNENLSIKIPDVIDLKFNEAEYIKTEVHTGNPRNSYKSR
jgi:hypothetical protein